MIFNMNVGGSSGGASIEPMDFSYTGKYSIEGSIYKDWVICLWESGELTFTKLGTAKNGIEVFIVGGGAGGNPAYNTDRGGGGGGGGYTKTSTIIPTVGTYLIDIGSGGTSGLNGNPTTAFGLTANGGNAGGTHGAGGTGTGKGGNGAFGNTSSGANAELATGGEDGVYAFEDSTAYIPDLGIGYKFGAGGGGASIKNAQNVYSGGDTSGGASGGGNGGARTTGSDGADNSGGGGGGGGVNGSSTYSGGKGGSGVVIIRNVRTAS